MPQHDGRGVPCDACEQPWLVGPAMPMPPLPVRPHSRPVGRMRECDPAWGVDTRYLIDNDRAQLTQRVTPVTWAEPPILYEAIAGRLTTPDRMTTIVRVTVPKGFNPLAVKCDASVEQVEWSDAVEFGLYIGSNQVGTIYRGSVRWPDWRPLRNASGQPGDVVSIAARIRPPFWHNGTRPVVSLIIARATVSVYCESIQPKC